MITTRLISSAGSVVWSKKYSTIYHSIITPSLAGIVSGAGDQYITADFADGAIIDGPSTLPEDVGMVGNGFSPLTNPSFAVVDDGTVYLSGVGDGSFSKVDIDGSILWTQTTPADGTLVDWSLTGSPAAVLYAKNVTIRVSPDYSKVATCTMLYDGSTPLAMELAEWSAAGSLLWNLLITAKNTESTALAPQLRWMEYEQSGKIWIYSNSGANTNHDPDDIVDGNTWRIDGGTADLGWYRVHNDSMRLYGSTYGYGYKYNSNNINNGVSSLAKYDLADGSEVDTITPTDGYSFRNTNTNNVPAVGQDGFVYAIAQKTNSPNRLYCYDTDFNLEWIFEETVGGSISDPQNIIISSAIDGYVLISGSEHPKNGWSFV